MDEQESPSADRPLNTITVAGRELLLVEVGGGTEIHLASEFAEGDTAIQIDGIPGDYEDPTLWEQTTLCGRSWQGMAPGADDPTLLWQDAAFRRPAERASASSIAGSRSRPRQSAWRCCPR